MSPIRAVWFDVGEVLINETREYGTWADWLGIPRHTFSAMFGAVIARGEDYRQVFQYFRPGFDLDAEWGVTKPDVAFFSKLIAVSGHQPDEIAYVGDRLDNDLRPAASAGLRTVFVKRGPWGYVIYEPRPADLELDSLTELPAALKTLPGPRCGSHSTNEQ